MYSNTICFKTRKAQLVLLAATQKEVLDVIFNVEK